MRQSASPGSGARSWTNRTLDFWLGTGPLPLPVPIQQLESPDVLIGTLFGLHPRLHTNLLADWKVLVYHQACEYWNAGPFNRADNQDNQIL